MTETLNRLRGLVDQLQSMDRSGKNRVNAAVATQLNNEIQEVAGRFQNQLNRMNMLKLQIHTDDVLKHMQDVFNSHQHPMTPMGQPPQPNNLPGQPGNLPGQPPMQHPMHRHPRLPQFNH